MTTTNCNSIPWNKSVTKNNSIVVIKGSWKDQRKRDTAVSTLTITTTTTSAAAASAASASASAAAANNNNNNKDDTDFHSIVNYNSDTLLTTTPTGSHYYAEKEGRDTNTYTSNNHNHDEKKKSMYKKYRINLKEIDDLIAITDGTSAKNNNKNSLSPPAIGGKDKIISLDEKQNVTTKFDNKNEDIDNENNIIIIENKSTTSSACFEFHDLITELNKTYGVPKAALKNDYYGRRKLLTNDIDSHYKQYFHTWNDQNPYNHKLLWTCIFLCPCTGEIFYAGPWNFETNPPNTSSSSTKTKSATGSTTSITATATATTAATTTATTTSTSTRTTTTISNNIDNSNNRQATQTCYPYYNNSNNNKNDTGKGGLLWWFPRKSWAEDGAAAVCFDCKVYRERQIIVEQEMLKDCTKRRMPSEVVRMGLEQPYDERDAILSFSSSDGTRSCSHNNDAMMMTMMVPSSIRSKIMEQQRDVFARICMHKQEQQQKQRQKQNSMDVDVDVYQDEDTQHYLYVYDGDSDYNSNGNDADDASDDFVNESDN